MPTASPRSVEFRSLKKLKNRFDAPRASGDLISVADRDVPRWQRQLVWTPEEMGLLVYSIIKNFPIGMMILWKRADGVRVPIDGRQRLTAIKEFFDGTIAIPDLPGVPPELHQVKYRLAEGDEEAGYRALPLEDRERFDDYEPSIVEYESIEEEVAMEIFVKLQGGKSLTKTEVRAALGGKLCDYVTELTSVTQPQDTEDDEEEAEEDEDQAPHHPFFEELSRNRKNRRKSHRNVCDTMLHEFLYPGQDKHWSSLEKMYRDKARTLTSAEKTEFSAVLKKFLKAVQVRRGRGPSVIIPQMRSAFFILTVFRGWRTLNENFALPSTFDFAALVGEFEVQRVEKADKVPWVLFTAALSNAGYAANRIEQRHDIFMSYILKKFPRLNRKDRQRAFNEDQKVAIWERANGKCEWEGGCRSEFEHPRQADADHIVRWRDGGPTTVENGRLLCQRHNRGRR